MLQPSVWAVGWSGAAPTSWVSDGDVALALVAEASVVLTLTALPRRVRVLAVDALMPHAPSGQWKGRRWNVQEGRIQWVDAGDRPRLLWGFEGVIFFEN